MCQKSCSIELQNKHVSPRATRASICPTVRLVPSNIIDFADKLYTVETQAEWKRIAAEKHAYTRGSVRPPQTYTLVDNMLLSTDTVSLLAASSPLRKATSAACFSSFSATSTALQQSLALQSHTVYKCNRPEAITACRFVHWEQCTCPNCLS